MTCPDVAQLLDAFVDTELPPAQLLDVARHAAGCPTCDDAIRELTALRQSVAALVEREARELDLSGVWPVIEAATSTRRSARVVPLRRAVSAAPVWGALLALAASLFFWFSAPTREAPDQLARPLAERQVASASNAASGRAISASNHAYIDRLAGKDIAVRREPKSGTTIIWVNHAVEDAR
jgi:anti-sigma factor RsiW